MMCITRQADASERFAMTKFFIPVLLMTFLSTILVPVRMAAGEETVRSAADFYAAAISLKPSVHDVGERMRIAKGINADGIGVYVGAHEAFSYPGDTDPDADDFREDSYAQLRSEIRMAYAELASCRGQIREVKRGGELLKKLVVVAHELYANGKLDQVGALKAQLEWEKSADALGQLEKREKILSLRLNVLAGISTGEPVPHLRPLGEYAPSFNDAELVIAYKSRRFLEIFQKVISPDKPATGAGIEEADTLEIEAEALVSSGRLNLENLQSRAKRYRLSLIPLLEMGHSARMERYRNGKLDFSMLLDGLVMLLDMRREYEMLLGESQMLKAKLEYVTGLDLE